MSWTDAEAKQAEDENRAYMLALHAAGEYRRLCEYYCHEGWDSGMPVGGWWNEDWVPGDLIEDAGICSYTVSHCTEAEALRQVADHIKTQILQGVLGC